MGLLQYVSDRGLLRDINEDYVFACRHPKDENIKMLLVADGMGGKNQGDVASQEVVASMEAWFYQQEVEFLRGINGINDVLDSHIKKFNTYLINKYGKDFLGTTLTVAIVGPLNTFVYNIGDSRCYIYKDRKLIQITEDDSGVWPFYKNGSVEKDDLRFFPSNNYITACIGLNEELCNSKSYVIDNNYDLIMLFSDGVTDLLGDNDIKKIIEKKKARDILNEIVNVAVNKDLKLKVPSSLKRKYKGKFSVPLHGRDNASGVMYITTNFDV